MSMQIKRGQVGFSLYEGQLGFNYKDKVLKIGDIGGSEWDNSIPVVYPILRENGIQQDATDDSQASASVLMTGGHEISIRAGSRITMSAANFTLSSMWLGVSAGNTDAKIESQNLTIQKPEYSAHNQTIAIHDLKDPESDYDAATKKYVDSKASGSPILTDTGLKKTATDGSKSYTSITLTDGHTIEVRADGYTLDAGWIGVSATDLKFNTYGGKATFTGKDMVIQGYEATSGGSSANNYDKEEISIYNVKTPTHSCDAANKQYVDGCVGGLSSPYRVQWIDISDGPFVNPGSPITNWVDFYDIIRFNGARHGDDNVYTNYIGFRVGGGNQVSSTAVNRYICIGNKGSTFNTIAITVENGKFYATGDGIDSYFEISSVKGLSFWS